MESSAEILLVEPFYGGSHKQLIDLLMQNSPRETCLISLTAKKWHWRARCSALKLSQEIPIMPNGQSLFCSSVLSLAELLGLRPDLIRLKKVVYFHENQLVYPVRNVKERDFQFGYNQITTCLAADEVLFNSSYNMNSFLDALNKFLKIMPDFRPKNVRQQIETKCSVLYFPMNFESIDLRASSRASGPLHIVWPHRWEFDKGPDKFFEALRLLKATGNKFQISVLGETFTDVPEVFLQMREEFEEEIANWGYQESKERFFEILQSAHIAVSTADHEFFGVSMLEATYCGCFPLVPNRLVYPEIYDQICLYESTEELAEKLADFCQNLGRADSLRKQLNIDFDRYSASSLVKTFYTVLNSRTVT